MTEYYVSGVIEIEGTCGRVTDEDAEFFTLYGKDDQGLSQCIADFTDRLSAEAVMQVYQERDALQQQVKDLQDKADFKKNLTEQVVDLEKQVKELEADCNRYSENLQYHITRQGEAETELERLKAEALSLVPYVLDGKEQKAFEHYAKEQRLDLEQHPLHYLFLDVKTNAVRNAWRECLNYVAAQLRQPEEKGHE